MSRARVGEVRETERSGGGRPVSESIMEVACLLVMIAMVALVLVALADLSDGALRDGNSNRPISSSGMTRGAPHYLAGGAR